MNRTTIRLDVRDDIRSGREPFSKIMAAANSLRPGQKLLVVAPFEPVPLIQLLGNQGFEHAGRPIDSGDWEVLFSRADISQGRPKARSSSVAPPAADALTTSCDDLVVDARGLEPPLPMIKILEAAASLPAGAELRGYTDRRPMHLYAQLEEQGFTAKTEEQSDGSFITHIRRR
jgi:uncharacterized protein (DUF2249 family)